jgi:hypothetical protein
LQYRPSGSCAASSGNSPTITGLTVQDLQYASVEPLEELSVQIISRLEGDGIPVRNRDLVVGDSAQQFLVLTAEIIAGLWGPEKLHHCRRRARISDGV